MAAPAPLQAWGERSATPNAPGRTTPNAPEAPRRPGSARGPGGARGGGNAGEAASTATVLNEALKSHREHRVTVPMPKNLDELRKVAQGRFRNGRGLYHHGRRHVSHNNHMSGMKHDDVVVVGMGNDEPTEALPMTTHRSHFVTHEVAVRDLCTPEQNIDGSGGKWYGESRYCADYQPKKTERPAPVRPVDGLKRTTGPTGNSSYRAQYMWNNANKPDRVTNHEVHSSAKPFDALSSYQADFIANQNPIPRSMLRPSERPGTVTGGQFYGTSTYGAHFEDPKVGRHPLVAPRPPAFSIGEGPFDSATEYTARYIKHPHEKPALLHLEPQMRSVTPRP